MTALKKWTYNWFLKFWSSATWSKFALGHQSLVALLCLWHLPSLTGTHPQLSLAYLPATPAASHLTIRIAQTNKATWCHFVTETHIPTTIITLRLPQPKFYFPIPCAFMFKRCPRDLCKFQFQRWDWSYVPITFLISTAGRETILTAVIISLILGVFDLITALLWWCLISVSDSPK